MEPGPLAKSGNPALDMPLTDDEIALLLDALGDAMVRRMSVISVEPVMGWLERAGRVQAKLALELAKRRGVYDEVAAELAKLDRELRGR